MAYGPTGGRGLRGWTNPAPHWNGIEWLLHSNLELRQYLTEQRKHVFQGPTFFGCAVSLQLFVHIFGNLCRFSVAVSK